MSAKKAEQQLKDAEKFCKEGEKAFKGGFFSKPDFPDAGSNFNKAADIFLQNKQFELAKKYFEKSGISYDKGMILQKSGSMYAQAAQAAFFMNEAPEVERLLLEAKMRYLEGNQALQAIRQLREMAEKAKQTLPALAYTLYEHALDLVEQDNQYHWEKDSFIDFALLALEMDKYPEVYKAWDRAAKAFLVLKNYDSAAHCIVSQIVLHLKKGDIVAAERLFDDSMQNDFFIRTDDFSMIDMIIRGVKSHDGDLLEIGQKNVINQFLKPEISRIIFSFKAPKSTPVPKEGNQKPAPRVEKTEEEETAEKDEEEEWIL